MPNEITRLLGKTYTWSVSFTDSSTDSDTTTFQVNAVVAIVSDGGVVIPATPGPSQTSSVMFSEGVSSSFQITDNTLTISSLHAAPETSLASGATPTKVAMDGSGLAETPHSTTNNAQDQDKASVAAADVPANSYAQAQKSATKKSPVHLLRKKLLRSCLLMKKLQMMVSVTRVQPSLIRPARARMHEQCSSC